MTAAAAQVMTSPPASAPGRRSAAAAGRRHADGLAPFERGARRGDGPAAATLTKSSSERAARASRTMATSSQARAFAAAGQGLNRDGGRPRRTRPAVDRQAHGHSGALAGRALDEETAAVQADEAADHREPEARPLVRAVVGRPGLEEGVA